MIRPTLFTRRALILTSAMLSAALAANAAEMDHSKMQHDMSPMVTTGPWSYKDRDTPDPHTKKRWEMIPVPGYGHLYISGGGLNKELRCAALMDNPRIMVDRKTQAECGKVPPPTVPERTPVHADHQH